MCPDIEVIKKRLIEAGADPEAIEKLSEETLQSIPEDSNFELFANIINLYDFLENFEKYKRKRINITIAEPLHNILKFWADRIVGSDGKPYPISYLIEDVLVWVLKDPDRFDEFMKETYEEEDEDEDADEESKEQKG